MAHTLSKYSAKTRDTRHELSFNVAWHMVDPLLNLYVYIMWLAKPLETHKIKVTLPYIDPHKQMCTPLAYEENKEQREKRAQGAEKK